ncbi:MAG: exodeoxyribonuclease VII small subunit [Polyangiaceae bacterium]
MSASDPPPAAKGPSFEQSVARLTEIVQALEKGDLPLEDSVRLFEEGVKLSVSSQQRLDSAQKKVEQLLGVDESGRPRVVAFETRGEDE